MWARLCRAWVLAIRSQALGMMPIEQTTTTTSRKSGGFGSVLRSVLGGIAARVLKSPVFKGSEE